MQFKTTVTKLSINKKINLGIYAPPEGSLDHCGTPSQFTPHCYFKMDAIIDWSQGKAETRVAEAEVAVRPGNDENYEAGLADADAAATASDAPGL